MGCASKNHKQNENPNPQIVRFGGGYFMQWTQRLHELPAGHFVLYYSNDAIHWDEGRYMRLCTVRELAILKQLAVKVMPGMQ